MTMATVAGKPPVTQVPGETPLEQLEQLCDPGSFRPLRSAVSSLRLGERAAPGDGVVAGAGEIEGRPVFCYAQDPKFLGGSLGEVHADTIVRTLQMAGDAGAPVVGFVRSGGARLQEGHAALAGYGRIFRASVQLSRKVPQVSILNGISAGGGAYSPALTDFVVMTQDSRMFLTGPKVVAEAMGEEISMEDLGGPRVHGKNGVARLVAADTESAIAQTRHLLALLPQRIGGELPFHEPVGPDGSDPGLVVPEEQRKVYDVREVAAAILDSGTFLEFSPRWAPNMVTGIARLEGRPVGLIANQPKAIGGVIDAAASEKAALFVNDCNRFGLPLLVFVDTPGFMPGKVQEEAGVIRHGASLLRAFAGATVPKVTLVLRKAFGGAAITMNSKDLGADVVFSWPGAQIGIMAARQAVGIVHGRALAAGDGPSRDELSDLYAAEHLTASAAAASGWVDEVIDPTWSRDRLAWALRSLGGR
jgi:acetyl-CoA carboxylase carboxyltransferase component